MTDTKELIAEARAKAGYSVFESTINNLADALEALEARAEAAELRVTAFINWQAEMQIERNGMLAEREADKARIERLRAVARELERFIAPMWPKPIFNSLDALQPGDLDD